MEQWKVIEDFPDYAVSNCGRVKRLTEGNYNTYPGKMLKSRLNRYGYPYVILYNKHKPTTIMVHKLVLKSFCSNYNELLQCNHIDGNKENNSFVNLQQVTPKENIKHAWENGLCAKRYGTKNPSSKLKEGEVWLIKKLLYFKNNNRLDITQEKISKMFKVSRMTITHINTNTYWEHIKYDCN